MASEGGWGEGRLKERNVITNQMISITVCLPGVFLLIVSLMLSARMGIFQEQTYAKFGKHPSEALFYNVSTEILFCLISSFRCGWGSTLQRNWWVWLVCLMLWICDLVNSVIVPICDERGTESPADCKIMVILIKFGFNNICWKTDSRDLSWNG